MITFGINYSLDGMYGDVDKTADQYQRKAAMELQSELIETTPRDTSRARSGWFIDAQHGAAVPPKGQASYTPQRQQAPKGASFIVVYNNVEYIVRLNEGHSTQAPARFVQLAIAKVQRGFV